MMHALYVSNSKTACSLKALITSGPLGVEKFFISGKLSSKKCCKQLLVSKQSPSLWLMEGYAIGKVGARKDSKKLFIDFRYDGQRFREQTLLDDNAKNRKQLEQLLQRMEAKMLLSEFNYAEFFPNSSNLQKLKAGQLINTAEPQNASNSDRPLFNDFATQWFEESKIQWRASQMRNVSSILDSSLKPTFGKKPMGEISKADIMSFRAKLSKRKGRHQCRFA